MKVDLGRILCCQTFHPLSTQTLPVGYFANAAKSTCQKNFVTHFTLCKHRFVHNRNAFNISPHISPKESKFFLKLLKVLKFVQNLQRKFGLDRPKGEMIHHTCIEDIWCNLELIFSVIFREKFRP